jgi:glycosyltransferase involved in cell wall biosynthesis
MKTETYDATICEINARLGRPLRILHIGNIANNAYNNACIQRLYGIGADVLCHDYYHVMATPEWEDSGLTTTVDPNLPNWWESNLKGFRRPEWFVQGPLALCLDYLEARHCGDERRQRAAAATIEESYINLLRLDALTRGLRWRDPRTLLQRYPGLLVPLGILKSPGPPLVRAVSCARALISATILSPIGNRLLAAPTALGDIIHELRRKMLWPLLAAAVAEPPRIRGARTILAGYALLRRTLRLGARDRLEIVRKAEVLARSDAKRAPRRIIARLPRLLRLLLRAAWLLMLTPVGIVLRRVWHSHHWINVATEDDRTTRGREIAGELLEGEPVPDAATALLHEEFKRYIGDHSLTFARVLAHYDIVQGYATDGIVPLANHHPAFASYEHGTLRELPFEASLSGLICRIAYRHSPAVFVTNTDVLPSVTRLGLAPERVHYLPHAFDDQKLMRWRDANPELSPPADGVVFFSPTRQHWRDANRSLTKGNDTMLRAAGRLWAEGRRFQLMLVEWGQDVAETKRLIEELGYSQSVRWVPPMGKQDLWRAYCTSHAVLDQFILPALGGVGFEALTLGCRLITRTDQDTLAHFFGAAPPVLPAATIDEVARSMASVIDDTDDRAGVGAAGRVWIDKWHSARRIVAIQAEVYRRLLGFETATATAVSGAPKALDAFSRTG